MSLTSKILAILAIVVLAVTGIWWLWIREPAPSADSNAVGETESPATTSAGTPELVRGPVVRVRTNIPARIETAPASTNLMADWEDRIDEILGDDTEVEDKARKMLELMPRFPVAGQVEAAQHVSNLLPDEDYEKFGRYLADPQAASVVQDVVLADVLNRPNEIKLPLLLEAARTPNHAKAAEAKEMLELYLEEDYGDDWNKWEEEMEKWLAENPD